MTASGQGVAQVGLDTSPAQKQQPSFQHGDVHRGLADCRVGGVGEQSEIYWQEPWVGQEREM